MQFRFHRRSHHGKSPIQRNPLFPRERLDLLKQIFKGTGFELSDAKVHPICGAKPQVGSNDPPLITAVGNLAILRAQHLISQFFNFPPNDGFQAEGGRCN